MSFNNDRKENKYLDVTKEAAEAWMRFVGVEIKNGGDEVCRRKKIEGSRKS